MTDQEIRERLQDHEDNLTVRKEKGVSTEDICKALVAFANSLSDGQEAVLFIGDAGVITDVDGPEKTQGEVQRRAER